jgi:glycosyltransferase involved in cell wall biosynthesis
MLLKRNKFDLVQIEFSMMWQYADLFKGTAVILDAHNIEYEIIHAVGKTFRNPLRKLSYYFEEKRLREVEEQAWRESSLCFTVSDRECEVIQQTTGQTAKVFTVPNGVDLQRFVFQPINDSNKRILFIGGLDYIPNLDSAQYFLRDIFPLIHLQIPKVELNIVGRELWRVRGETTSPGVEFHENVPDVLPYFRKAGILVVPLRYGAGTRIKILEAMAAGLPVVTTSKGCEGLDVKNNEHLLIADTPESFAHAVHKLLEDAGLRAYITKNARHLVEQKYSWEIIVSDIEKYYEKIKKVNSV